MRERTTHNAPLDTFAPWGKNYMTLISNDGKVKLSNDRFDYEQHDLGMAWDEGGRTWTYEFFIGHLSISIYKPFMELMTNLDSH